LLLNFVFTEIEQRYGELQEGSIFLGYDVAPIGNRIQILRSSVLPWYSRIKTS